MKSILSVLSGKSLDTPPCWLMRQAGRYLPEYRAEREKAGSFLDLALNPRAATEVTLQPIRRFGLDAAIIFSDILMVPYGLGQALAFEAGEGPVLEAIRDDTALGGLNFKDFEAKLSPVFEALALTKSLLPSETTLIGFCGAPWTVAAYMIEGRGKQGFTNALAAAKQHPALMKKVIDMLVEASIIYLDHQIRAGAEVIQIFDSWAGLLDEAGFETWSIEPTRRIVEGVRACHPHVPIIGFPREQAARAAAYRQKTGVNAVQLDSDVSAHLAQTLAAQGPVQGWLAPDVLLGGGQELVSAVQNMKAVMRGLPYVFNLGHGVIKETPPEHVALLVQTLREAP